MLSEESLSKKGVNVLSWKTSVILLRHDTTFATGLKSGSFHRLTTICTPLNKTEAALVVDLLTWQKRHSHAAHVVDVQMTVQNILTSTEISKGLKTVFCESCSTGNMARFETSLQAPHKTLEVLELVHSEGNGPIEASSKRRGK